MIDPRPYAAALAQAQAKKAGDQATLANAQVNLQRYSTLAKSDFASRQQVENQNAAVRMSQANVQADDAAITAAQLNLDFCRITAPIDGVVGFRLVDIGNLVQANGTQAIVTLMQVRPVAVVFTLAQQDLPAVRAALAAGKPEVLAFSADDATQLSAGTLLTPNNTIDTSTGTISLKAVFPNDDRKLWPGQFVNAHLRLRVDKGAVTVPVAAVQHGPDESVRVRGQAGQHGRRADGAGGLPGQQTRRDHQGSGRRRERGGGRPVAAAGGREGRGQERGDGGLSRSVTVATRPSPDALDAA